MVEEVDGAKLITLPYLASAMSGPLLESFPSSIIALCFIGALILRGLKDDTRDEDRASIKQRTIKEEGKLISKHPIMGNKQAPSA